MSDKEENQKPPAEEAAPEAAAAAAQEPTEEEKKAEGDVGQTQDSVQKTTDGEEVKEEDPAEDSEEIRRKANMKGVDEFYDEGYVAKQLVDSKISKRNADFFATLGIPSMKRYNIHFLTDDVIIFVTGNKYQTYDMATK